MRFRGGESEDEDRQVWGRYACVGGTGGAHCHSLTTWVRGVEGKRDATTNNLGEGKRDATTNNLGEGKRDATTNNLGEGKRDAVTHIAFEEGARDPSFPSLTPSVAGSAHRRQAGFPIEPLPLFLLQAECAAANAGDPFMCVRRYTFPSLPFPLPPPCFRVSALPPMPAFRSCASGAT